MSVLDTFRVLESVFSFSKLRYDTHQAHVSIVGDQKAAVCGQCVKLERE